MQERQRRFETLKARSKVPSLSNTSQLRSRNLSCVRLTRVSSYISRTTSAFFFLVVLISGS
jgi:hypothetical protein